MQAAELRYNYSYCSSDTYASAYQQAREALGSQPVSNSTLARMDLLSRELAANMRDSSESLRDVRKICRKAVIEAIRVHIGAEIDRVIADLDEIRRSGVSSTVLDRAICSAFGARVNLETAPFRDTLRHLDTACALRDTLTGASPAGEHVSRVNLGNSAIRLAFDSPSVSLNRAGV